MPSTHAVVQGECISSLAYKYRLPIEAIYDDPNNADLKAKRPNPNILFPGDQVYIPDPKQRSDDEPVDQRHFFVVSFPPAYVNIRLQNLGEEPIKNARYELKLDVVTLNGSTDDDGWIRSQIPPSAELGTLTVWPNPDDQDTSVQWSVNLGHLDPIDTTSGTKGRLNNLCYYWSDVDNVDDAPYDDSWARFQQDSGTSTDDTTDTALNKVHQV